MKVNKKNAWMFVASALSVILIIQSIYIIALINQIDNMFMWNQALHDRNDIEKTQYDANRDHLYKIIEGYEKELLELKGLDYED